MLRATVRFTSFRPPGLCSAIRVWRVVNGLRFTVPLAGLLAIADTRMKSGAAAVTRSVPPAAWRLRGKSSGCTSTDRL